MLKSALEYLVGLGKTETLQLEGQNYTTKQIHHVKQPTPAPIELSTLNGLVDYIRSNVDVPTKELILHIVSPTTVRLLSTLHNDKGRDCYIECKAIVPRIDFGVFHEVERFNIMLQSSFVPSIATAEILKIVGNIREETIRETGDDGISQAVTIKAGIARVADVTVPNPVELAPYRTFVEVEQPTSKFVFRMKDGPQCALFEADGGLWRIHAIANIKKFFDKELHGFGVRILA